jgi:hypothetical protein
MKGIGSSLQAADGVVATLGDGGSAKRLPRTCYLRKLVISFL